MVTGAITYDWLYPLLTPEERQAFIRELVRLAKTLECGYPPTRQGSITGHSSEAMIMRDMLSAGIAIYDEFSRDVTSWRRGAFFREHLPARTGFTMDTHITKATRTECIVSVGNVSLWIFDRMGAGNVYNPEQRFVPYLWVYTARPDGQRLRAGDILRTARRAANLGEISGPRCLPPLLRRRRVAGSTSAANWRRHQRCDFRVSLA
jgi:heparin/heparan-sulfate lyase